MINKNFKSIINNIKKEIKNTQTTTIQQVNSNLIKMYFRIGKILASNNIYGNKFIKNISRSIRLDNPNVKGFSERNLKYMQKLYLEYKDNKKMQQLVAQLPWGHNILLIEKIKNIKIRRIYIDASIDNGWSRNMLDLQIKSNYHERIGNSTNNFSDTLSYENTNLVTDIIKDPYIFNFISLNNNYREKDLESKLVEKMKNVLLELGTGFSFVGNQYKLTVGNKDYYIDLLFYHLKLKCYIVVELKISEFKPEYIGKMNFYLSAVDDLIKQENDNQTIGLILCRTKNKFTAQYSLKDINKPIGVSSFTLKDYLPTEDDINLYIDNNLIKK